MADAGVVKPMKLDVPVVGLCIGMFLNTLFFVMCLVHCSIDLPVEAKTERLAMLAGYYEWRASPPVLVIMLLIIFPCVLLFCIDIAKGAIQSILQSHRASAQRHICDVLKAIMVMLVAIPIGLTNITPANLQIAESCGPDALKVSSVECVASLEAAKPLHLFMVVLQFALLILCCIKYGGNSGEKDQEKAKVA